MIQNTSKAKNTTDTLNRKSIRCNFTYFELVDDFHDCLKIKDKARGQKL